MENVLWWLLYAGLFYFMMRFGCGAHMSHGGHGSHGSDSNHSPGEMTFKDPVCGMNLGPDTRYSLTYEGREYRFCSRKCLDAFDFNPAAYVGMKKAA